MVLNIKILLASLLIVNILLLFVYQDNKRGLRVIDDPDEFVRKVEHKPKIKPKNIEVRKVNLKIEVNSQITLK